MTAVTVFGTAAHRDVETWVGDLHRALRRTGTHGLADLAQAAPHPHLDLVAVAAVVRHDPDGPAERRVLLVGPTGAPRPVAAGVDVHSPVWSPDGLRLCVLGPEVLVVDVEGRERDRLPVPGGRPESARWAPDATILSVVVADSGSEVSDVEGSGRSVTDPHDAWRPHVSPAGGGRRRLLLWSPGAEVVEPTSLHVWEADWVGDHLVALVSDHAGEDAWYGARLVTVTPTGTVTTLHEDRLQLAHPAGAPDGRYWAALTGLASDRGVLAGSVLVGEAGGVGAVVPTADVHVTDLRWSGPGRILTIGHRGLETVLGTVLVPSGTWTEHRSGPETTGRVQAELGGPGHDGRPVVVLEAPDLPPSLVRLHPDGAYDVLLDTAGPASETLLGLGVTTRQVAWTAPDGWVVQGFLDLPPVEGPHALVVHAHGGPVGLHRPAWPGRDAHTATLLARGYAVLRPNPRGSTGRGHEFAHAVVGDVGGADARDILAGIDKLVADGVVDPGRIGLLGQSYGGFLACWMPTLTDTFRASVARSPCTDWVSLHRTSNVPELARRLLVGDVDDPGSQYTTRSPLARRADLRTPVLLTAGTLDLATPDSQARQLHRALLDQGVESALAVYPQEGHGIVGARALADQCARMVTWFERYLPVGR